MTAVNHGGTKARRKQRKQRKRNDVNFELPTLNFEL
jgi:hypothetical protein